MPPQQYDSESDVEPAPRGKKRQPVSDVEMDDQDEEAEDQEDGEEEDDEEGGDDDEYVVEAIKNHKFEATTGELLLLVKWKGYDKKSDMTWEPEENCAGAKEIVAEYFRSVGGRPTQPESSKKKRARPSTGGAASAKKKKATPAREHSGTPDEPKWRPPAGSWEDEIQAIDTIEKTDKGLICYIQWGNGKKSQHEVHTVYKKAPQRMLHFYEQHLVFKESTGQNNAYKDGE